MALLALRPRHAAAIAEEIGLSRPATSRQLHLMEDAGLIRRSWITRDGRRRLFTIELQSIGPITAWLAGVELDRRRSERS
jgi:DNA-binding MarR family transcriptional regulator